ncbi:MAG: divergent polysaccharide deacetylase family protein [Campylobacterota bacterium]|nr:divergent polysaccharide deacetylase family protein [Campylobacterota bacterium]
MLITLIALGITTYFYMQDDDIKEQNKIKEKLLKEQKIADEKAYQDQRAKYFEEKTKALDIEYSTNIEHTTYIEKPKKDDKNNFKYEDFNYNDKKEIKTVIKEDSALIKEKPIKDKPAKDKKEDTTVKTIKKSNNPKLAIIIDDVTTSSQMNKILDIGYNINMAFLPPTPRHKNSAKIAQKLDTYMIHLPLQASSYKYDEKNTLYVNSDYETIENRINILKEQYPKAKFINNHTGSKFTSNQEAMDRLFSVLKKHNYTFIDSRTTAKSVAKISAKKYGVRLLSRNIFLDNNKDKKYIQNQLKKAIKIAKKHGTAIAIGHPYNITFQTLKDSKHLLKGIDLVYVNKL